MSGMAGTDGKRLHGWWGNKPPSIRLLVEAGVLSFAALLVIAVILDTNVLNQQELVPSLAPFVWDLAKATLLGTVVVAIFDDLRSWGAHWSVLQARNATLQQATTNLTKSIWEYLSVDRPPVAFSAHESVKRLATWFGAIHQYEYDASFGHGSRSTHIRTWLELSACLGELEEFVPVPDPERLSKPASIEPTARAVAQLMAELEALSHPQATVATHYVIGNVRARIDQLPRQLELVRTWLKELPTADPPIDSEQLSGGAVALLTQGPQVTMLFIEQLLSVVEQERTSGWAHSYRS